MRRRAASVAVVVALLVALLVTPATAGSGPVAIGDSVMRGARPQLHVRGFRVDAVVSRQFSEGVSVVRRLADRGELPNRVVVHLGNNGYLTMAQCEDLVDAVGNRSLWLVTLRVPRRWREGNNHRLARCANHHDGVELIDWSAHARGHPAWFADDGYHLTTLGARRYAAFVDHRV